MSLDSVLTIESKSTGVPLWACWPWTATSTVWISRGSFVASLSSISALKMLKPTRLKFRYSNMVNFLGLENGAFQHLWDARSLIQAFEPSGISPNWAVNACITLSPPDSVSWGGVCNIQTVEHQTWPRGCWGSVQDQPGPPWSLLFGPVPYALAHSISVSSCTQ